MDINSYLNLERTLAIVKPHAFQHSSSILRRIKAAGFHVLQKRYVKLSIEQVEKFFKCSRPTTKSNDVVSMEIKELSSGPLIALCLSRENAITAWLELMGPEDCSVARNKSPTSIRAWYGDDNGNVIRNAVYGSKCASDALTELHFFFSNIIPESIPHSFDDIHSYISDILIQPLTDALYEMLKIRPIEPLEWIAKYVLDNNIKQMTIHPVSSELFHLIDELKMNEKNQEVCEKESRKTKLECGCSMVSENSLQST